jgi:mannose-1-phosphate guanylyltransferase
MQLYEAAIQEADRKSSKWIYCYFGIVPTKPETGYGYSAKAMM